MLIIRLAGVMPSIVGLVDYVSSQVIDVGFDVVDVCDCDTVHFGECKNCEYSRH